LLKMAWSSLKLVKFEAISSGILVIVTFVC
jgi:hypothetical protein